MSKFLKKFDKLSSQNKNLELASLINEHITFKKLKKSELVKSAHAAMLMKNYSLAERCYKLIHISQQELFMRVNHAVCLVELEEFHAAVKIFEKLDISSLPEFALLRYFNALYSLQNYAEAENLLKKQLNLLSNVCEANYRLGLVNEKLNRNEQSLSYYEIVLENKPDHLPANLGKIQVLRKLGRYSEAKETIRTCRDLGISNNEIENLMGLSLLDQGKITQSIGVLKGIVEKFPDEVDANVNLGAALVKIGDIADASYYFNQALKFDNECIPAINGLAMTLADVGDFKRALEYLDLALRIEPNNREVLFNKSFVINYAPGISNLEKKQTLEALYRCVRSKVETQIKPKSLINHKIKFGFISADLRKHAVSYFLQPLLSGLSEIGHEIILYSNSKFDDQTTDFYKSLLNSKWREIFSMDDHDVCALIMNDDVDVLIDLSGHTSGSRLSVMAMKPAPVSATWLGFNSSTGISEIDYFITNNAIVPISSNQYFSEKLLKLPSVFTAYSPPTQALDEDQFDDNPNAPFVFSTNSRNIRFNNLVVETWSKILSKCPEAVLHINGSSHKESQAAEILIKRFENCGIHRSRVLVYRESPVFEKLKLANVTLDCFPHNSGTTLFESLYAGVPFLTLEGTESVGRLGASILNELGLSEFVAQNIEEYIDKAVMYARRVSDMPNKQEINQLLMNSDFMDELNFAKNFVQTFESAILSSEEIQVT